MYCFIFGDLINYFRTAEDDYSSQLLAWCSQLENNVKVIEVATGQEYVKFKGPQLDCDSNNRNKIPFVVSFYIIIGWYESWTHVREIPGSRLLISLHHCHDKYASLEVFDLKNKGRATKVYSLGAVLGSKN